MVQKSIRFTNDLRDLLLEVSAHFVMYAKHHLAKNPPDFTKAIINMEWAKRCHDAATNALEDS